jgi:hydrogenase nickel incorporation protein HypA/HybF
VHEYALAQAMVSRVLEAAREKKATRVCAVTVSVGELAGVEPDFLRQAYEMVRVGTLLEEAPLELMMVPARYLCPECGRLFERGEVLRCEGCDRPARLEGEGDEILLRAVELEVP